MSLTRRGFLKGTAATGVAAAVGGAWSTGRAGASGGLRAYVLVVDGCRPDEVVGELMPRLSALRAGGTNFPNARSLPVMETIPNHVMMMTGVRPDRSGVPANSVYDRNAGVIRDLDRASDLRFPTLLERLASSGVVTGSVLSKRYLHGIFEGRATVSWTPSPVVPGSGHAPDAATVDALIDMVESHDPRLVFVNLGDVDRMGHADETGGLSVKAMRSAALADTDLQLGRFLDHLVATGRWASSVVLVLADHSMDWSLPSRVVSLTPVFRADPVLAGRVVVAQNGGADLCYWTGPLSDRAAAVARMSELAAGVDGVLGTYDPAALRLGPEAGDLVAYCRSGWRFTEPAVVSNPIPGNHGHPATAPIPFFVGGGWAGVRRRTSSSARASTVDVAPTIGALFGIGAPDGGYDGTARAEAFST